MLTPAKAIVNVITHTNAHKRYHQCGCQLKLSSMPIPPKWPLTQLLTKAIIDMKLLSALPLDKAIITTACQSYHQHSHQLKHISSKGGTDKWFSSSNRSSNGCGLCDRISGAIFASTIMNSTTFLYINKCATVKENHNVSSYSWNFLRREKYRDRNTTYL